MPNQWRRWLTLAVATIALMGFISIAAIASPPAVPPTAATHSPPGLDANVVLSQNVTLALAPKDVTSVAANNLALGTLRSNSVIATTGTTVSMTNTTAPPGATNAATANTAGTPPAPEVVYLGDSVGNIAAITTIATQHTSATIGTNAGI